MQELLFCLYGFVSVICIDRILSKSLTYSDFNSEIANRIFCANALSNLPILLIWLGMFLLDYYIPGSAIQGYNRTSDSFSWFYRLFGEGKSGSQQLPLLHMDLCFVGVMFGILTADIVLIAITINHFKTEKKNCTAAGKDLGIKTITSKIFEFIYTWIRREKQSYRSGLHPIEYVLWWSGRLLMAGVLIHHIIKGYDSFVIMLLSVNLAMTFVVPILRLLTCWLPSVYHMPLRVQTMIDIFIFGGSFLGQGLEFYSKFEDYDKILHLISGGLVVLIGVIILQHFKTNLSTTRQCLIGVGLSTQVMLVWECFEFIADFVFENASNQNWNYNPNPDMFFFRLFGYGASNPGQSALLDTNFDLLFALFGCVICVVFYLLFEKLFSMQTKTKSNHIAFKGVVSCGSQYDDQHVSEPENISAAAKDNNQCY